MITRTIPSKASRLIGLMALVVVAGGCATRPFEAPGMEQAPFLERVVIEEQGDVRVSATVPTAEEIVATTGLDLYADGIQPVWLKVDNNGSRPVRVALYSIDDEYYSPMEVAWLYRKGYSKEGRADMERWLYEHGLPRGVPPGESRSGFVFTHLSPGTKGFNVDLHASNASFNFTFFVPLPGFRPDYMDVRFGDLYAEEELRTVELDGLRQLLAGFDCCSEDATDGAAGDPFNVVIVATPVALRRALLRSQWQETQSGSPDSALARRHHFDGRIPDGTFHWSRPDGSEQKELRIWLSPIRVGDVPVWLAQASYDMSSEGSFDNYQIDPDLDDARAFVLQSFWYGQSLAKFGLAAGVPAATMDAPRQNFIGDAWFSDGNRIVMVVPEAPVGMDETEILPWEKFSD